MSISIFKRVELISPKFLKSLEYVSAENQFSAETRNIWFLRLCTKPGRYRTGRNRAGKVWPSFRPVAPVHKSFILLGCYHCRFGNQESIVGCMTISARASEVLDPSS